MPINDPLQTVYQLMSGRMPASATVRTACVFASIPSRRCVFALPHDKSLGCLSSAVERRSGATGALTWPWFCPISHIAKTWILAPSPPWVTHLVRPVTTYYMHQSSLPQSSSHLRRYFSTIILFCGSIQGADRRRPFLLLDGPSWSGSLHQEEHQDGSHWLQPQVRRRATGNNTCVIVVPVPCD